MSGPTAHVANRPETLHSRSESVQELAIERLVLELLKDPTDVFVSDTIVGALNVAALLPFHRNRPLLESVVALARSSFLIMIAPETYSMEESLAPDQAPESSPDDAWREVLLNARPGSAR